MSDPRPRRLARLTAVSRNEERVTALELFFDLVFVLAITQCTAMMADRPTWQGVGQGLLVLTVLWWAWVGYAWLTSVVDPEEGSVRLVIFVAMAALLVAAIAGPEAFDDLGLTFAVAVGVVRVAHIALFVLASRGEAELRASVQALAVSTAIGIGLLVGASFADGRTQASLWVLAILLDLGGPLVAGVNGWKLEPGHFAERHGLVVLIALGESIVAIGASADRDLTIGPLLAVILGVVLAATMWWAYFDVVAIAAGRRLAELAVGRERNRVARDSYSYLHLPMVAGIVLSAFGLKTTLHDVEHELGTVPACALYGGVALYLVGHVAFRLRNVHSLNRQRLALAALLAALIPLARVIPAVSALAMIAGLMVVLIAYETVHFAAARQRIRHGEAPA